MANCICSSLTHEEALRKILGGGGARVGMMSYRRAGATSGGVEKSILELISTVTIFVAGKRFAACEKFVCGINLRTRVKIMCVDRNFADWFMFGGGKIENPDKDYETDLRCDMMYKELTDKEVIAKLGGEPKAETTLAEIYILMAKQANGERGVLAKYDDQLNIFYVRDINNILRTVRLKWNRRNGWCISADSVKDHYGWSGGHQVFSRESLRFVS